MTTQTCDDEWPVEYFERRAAREGDRQALPLRKQPCGDCPVIWGMHRPISDGLKRCPPELQLSEAQKWFCHETPMCACRGNADNLGLIWTAKEQP